MSKRLNTVLYTDNPDDKDNMLFSEQDVIEVDGSMGHTRQGGEMSPLVRLSVATNVYGEHPDILWDSHMTVDQTIALIKALADTINNHSHKPTYRKVSVEVHKVQVPVEVGQVRRRSALGGLEYEIVGVHDHHVWATPLTSFSPPLTFRRSDVRTWELVR